MINAPSDCKKITLNGLKKGDILCKIHFVGQGKI